MKALNLKIELVDLMCRSIAQKLIYGASCAEYRSANQTSLKIRPDEEQSRRVALLGGLAGIHELGKWRRP